jgi:hypothetical protein
MKRVLGFSLLGASLAIAALLSAGPTTAASSPLVYFATLNGPSESPPNGSAGTGLARVTVDTSAHTLRVQVRFSGLTGTTTASHIHACTSAPGTGTAGVATTTPTFAGFPLGVTSGTYDRTLDLTLVTSYNLAFVNGAPNNGSVAAAEALLESCIAADKAYLNVHSSFKPGGEIRGFLLPGPATIADCKGDAWQDMTDPRTADTFRNQGQCVSFVDNGSGFGTDDS